MTDWTHATAPTLEDFAILAEVAFAALPPMVRAAAGEIVFRIDDFADEDILADLGIEDPFDLSGLYQGLNRLGRSVLDPSPEVSRVFLYRRPILDDGPSAET
jgi:predicted Zn-dependent protease with MMP-like domain